MHSEISMATVATAQAMPPHDVAAVAHAADSATTDSAADSNADPAGYAPQRLTLKGFRGIRDGLGRDELTINLDPFGPEIRLVAISGVNGRGKTTVMDNLHPLC